MGAVVAADAFGAEASGEQLVAGGGGCGQGGAFDSEIYEGVGDEPSGEGVEGEFGVGGQPSVGGEGDGEWCEAVGEVEGCGKGFAWVAEEDVGEGAGCGEGDGRGVADGKEEGSVGGGAGGGDLDAGEVHGFGAGSGVEVEEEDVGTA